MNLSSFFNFYTNVSRPFLIILVVPFNFCICNHCNSVGTVGFRSPRFPQWYRNSRLRYFCPDMMFLTSIPPLLVIVFCVVFFVLPVPFFSELEREGWKVSGRPQRETGLGWSSVFRPTTSRIPVGNQKPTSRTRLRSYVVNELWINSLFDSSYCSTPMILFIKIKSWLKQEGDVVTLVTVTQIGDLSMLKVFYSWWIL